MALSTAKHNLVAEVLKSIMVSWAHQPDNVTWKKHLELAFRHTNKAGTTIGVFSNLAARLGVPVDPYPFFQVTAERLPMRLTNVEGWMDNFGMHKYLGEHYGDCAALAVPFLTYANLLYSSPKNRLWNIQVGDLSKGEALVLTFESKRALVKLALWGHVLIKDARLINENVPAARTISLGEVWPEHLAEFSEERVVAELRRNRKGFPIESSWHGVTGVVGTYSGARIEQGEVVVDVNLLDPQAYGPNTRLEIKLRQVRDPQRSRAKYKKRHITPHMEWVAVIQDPDKD
jgi:hypothetical protein